MKRFHVHVRVSDVSDSVRFYSALFAAAPAVLKHDYAKWMLDDPLVNFAISTREGTGNGLDHLGIQVETEAELDQMQQRLEAAALPIASQVGTSCCYAKSDKHWSVDPQGIAWESYLTLGTVPTYGESRLEAMPQKSACCAPAAVEVSVSNACGSKQSSCC